MLLSVSRGFQSNLADAQSSPLRDSDFDPQTESLLYKQPFKLIVSYYAKAKKNITELEKNFLGKKDGRRVHNAAPFQGISGVLFVRHAPMDTRNNQGMGCALPLSEGIEMPVRGRIGFNLDCVEHKSNLLKRISLELFPLRGNPIYAKSKKNITR